jgi:single-strand DNA-binding protein
MNLVVLVGNLTADPEIRYAGNGTAVANIRIAVRRAFRKEGGPEADFFRVTIFGKQAEMVEKYLSKGQKVGIEGRIENNNYEKDGKTVYQDQIIANNIEFLSPKGSSGGGNYSGGGQGGGNDPFAGQFSGPGSNTGGASSGDGFGGGGNSGAPGGSLPTGISEFDDDEDDLPF